MQRRSVLRAAGAGLAAAALPTVSARADAFSARSDAFSARSDEFEPRSRLPIEDAREAVVGPDGRTAYVATMDGFATVDVSDPDAPAVLAERRDLLADRDRGPLARIQDLKVDGDRLAVAGPSHGGGLSGVLLYDVADPADPRRLAFHGTEFPIHNCDLEAGLLALTGNDGRANPTVFVEVGDDDTRELGRWSLYDVDRRWEDVPLGARSIHDVTLADGVAYCAHWDAGTWLLDVADPADPTALGRAGGTTPEKFLEMSKADQGFQGLEPPGNAHYAEVGDDGTVLAVGGESWDGHRGDGHGGPSGIDLWDVADPANPEHLASIEPLVPRDATRGGTWTTAHNFELTGGRLYSSWYHDGVKLHDVSDPTAPEELAHWRDPARARFWTARLGRAGAFFVAADMGTRGPDGTDGALYTFPDSAGSQPDQPVIETATPTPPPTPTLEPTRTPGDRATPTPPTTASETATPTPDGVTVTPSPTGTTTPGFGALAALGGLGVAGWRLLADRDRNADR